MLRPVVRHIGPPSLDLRYVVGARHQVEDRSALLDRLLDVRVVHAHDLASAAAARRRARLIGRPWGVTTDHAEGVPVDADLVLVRTVLGASWDHPPDTPFRPLWIDDDAASVAADVTVWWQALGAGSPLPPARLPRRGPRTVTIVVPTYQRRELLRRTLDALAAQDYPRELVDVVVVDNGSTDGTAELLAAGHPGLPGLRVVTHRDNQRVTTARNSAVRISDADLVAFTDDDCRPQPAWLTALVAAARDGVGIVQGITRGDPAQPRLPLSRTQDTPYGYGLFETCNIAYVRAALPDPPFDDALPAELIRRFGDRFARDPAGEDTDLGWRLLDGGWEARFTAAAEVHHEVFAPDPSYLLRRARLVSAFPLLVSRHPQLRRTLLTWGVFLSPVQPAIYLAALGLAIGVATRRPAAMLATLPYLRARLRPSVPGRRGRMRAFPTVVRVDLRTTAALLVGSVRTRTPVL